MTNEFYKIYHEYKTHPVEQQFPPIDKTLHTNTNIRNIVDLTH